MFLWWAWFFLHVVKQPKGKTSPGPETCLRNLCFRSRQSHRCLTFFDLLASHWTMQWITNQLARPFANSEAHAAPFEISYLICANYLKLLKHDVMLWREHVTHLVFMFWQMTKWEVVGRRQRHLIYFRHWSHHNAF